MLLLPCYYLAAAFPHTYISAYLWLTSPLPLVRRDLYDTDVVKHKRFEADWKRMLKLGIVKWVAWGSMGSVPPSRFFFDSCLRP